MGSPSGFSSKRKSNLVAGGGVSATVSPEKGGKGGQVNIEMTKVTSSKTELLAANNETHEDEESHSPRFEDGLCYTPYAGPPEQERITALWKTQQPLEEFLLFFAFISEANDDIPLMAMSIVSENMNQRGRLVDLL